MILKSLVINAMQMKSANSLLQSTTPKEAGFKILFINSLLASLPPNIQEWPQLSLCFQDFGASGQS
jgi:hypothetical protein